MIIPLENIFHQILPSQKSQFRQKDLRNSCRSFWCQYFLLSIHWTPAETYVFNSFEACVRYQNMHKDGESSEFVDIGIGYNFSLGSAK
jgi:hypothetical protein